MKLFGSNDLCKCLKRLAFTPLPQNGTSHVKYKVLPDIKTTPGIRPYIIVILGRKTYDRNTCSSYITQLKRLGFSKEDIIKNLHK